MGMYGSTKKKASGFSLSPLEQEEQMALEGKKGGERGCSLSLQPLNYRELPGLDSDRMRSQVGL